MSLALVIDQRAEAEIAKTYDWYLDSSTQAAANFKQEIDETFKLLKQDIIVYHESYRKQRRCTLKVFPYHIYYQRNQEENTIRVIAFVHNKRSPDFIKNRL